MRLTRRRSRKDWIAPAAVILALIVQVGSAIAQSDPGRLALLVQEGDEFNDEVRIELLSRALSPEHGPPDSAWTAAVQRLAMVLTAVDRPTDASLWMRWAVRSWPEFEPYLEMWTPAIVEAYQSARRYVESSTSPVDSLVVARWEWPEAAQSDEGSIGRVRFEGSRGGMVVAGNRVARGGTSLHRAGSYAMRSDEQDDFSFTAEILPGITLVVEYELPVMEVVDPVELARYLNPALVAPDTLFEHSLQRLADTLVRGGSSDLAAVWLRWAIRQRHDLAPGPDAPFALGRWYQDARSFVDSTSGDADGRIATSWRWVADATAGAQGSVGFVGTPGGLSVDGRLVDSAQVVQLPPGSYRFASEAYPDVALRAEVLPGVTTVVTFDLPPLPIPTVIDLTPWPWAAEDLTRVPHELGHRLETRLDNDTMKVAIREFIARSGLVSRESVMSFTCARCLDTYWFTSDSAKTEHVRFFMEARGSNVFVLANDPIAEERWATDLNRELALRYVVGQLVPTEPAPRAGAMVGLYFSRPGWSGTIYQTPVEFPMAELVLESVFANTSYSMEPLSAVSGLVARLFVNQASGDSIFALLATARVSTGGRPQGDAQVGVGATRVELADSVLAAFQAVLVARVARGRIREEKRPATKREIAMSVGYVQLLDLQIEDAYTVVSRFVEAANGEEQHSDGDQHLWRIVVPESGALVTVILERDRGRAYVAAHSTDMAAQKTVFRRLVEALGVPNP